MNLITEKDYIDDTVFQHPFTCMLAGPTMSGKTTILTKILSNTQVLIDKKIDRVIYCYARWQNSYDKMKLDNPSMEFVEGLPEIDLINANQNNLMVLDDLMDQCKKEKSILNLFTTDSHQKSISVFLITQNLFSQGKIFANNRPKLSLFVFAQQSARPVSNLLLSSSNVSQRFKISNRMLRRCRRKSKIWLLVC